MSKLNSSDSSTKVRLKKGDALLPAIIEGISPEVTLTPVEAGVQMTVTTKSGTKTALIPKGEKGDNYTLTPENIQEIGGMFDSVRQTAEAARDVAISARDVAAQSATAAGNAADSATAQVALAEQAKADALQAKSDSLAAKAGAEEAAQDAETAKADTQEIYDAATRLTTRIESLERDARAAKIDAEGAATAAAASQDEAALSADAAASLAGTAEIHAREAQEAASDAAGAAGDAATMAGEADASATAAAESATQAAGSASQAAQTAAGIEAAGAAQVAAIEEKGEEVLGSIPSDYSQLAADVSNLNSAINDMNTATADDVGKALKAKTVSDGKVTEWEFGATGEGWTTAMKEALLQCFRHVEWDDQQGQTYYNELRNSLYPPISITAVYDSTHTAEISDTLDSLRPYITVTAHYNGARDTVVTDYALSGTLNVGDNIITVIFGGLRTTITVTAIRVPNVYDVCLFAGQSNMDGRGNAAEAPTVSAGQAYKWDKSTQTVVDFAAEPSLIPAYVKTYYEQSGVPIVEVKRAEGGMSIQNYIDQLLTDACTQLENCVAYLRNAGKTVRRIFFLWNQGENDVDYSSTESTGTALYMERFEVVKNAVMESGVQKLFIINIGQMRYHPEADYSKIRTALQNVCDGENVIMVSDKFYKSEKYMKSDAWHYTQTVYNVVGKDAAENTVSYYTTGVAPVVDRFHEYGDVLPIPEQYADFDYQNWTFETNPDYGNLHIPTVTLKAHIGSNDTVHVSQWYKYDDDYYRTLLTIQSGSVLGTFGENTTIKHLSFDDDVLYGNGSASQQTAAYALRGMSNLESVTNVPKGAQGADQAFAGTEKLAQHIDLTGWAKSFRACFNGSGVTSIGDISNATDVVNLAADCSALTSVGNITGTFTQLSGIFANCTSLETVGNIESTGLANTNQAFKNLTTLRAVGNISGPITGINALFQGCTSLESVGRITSSGNLTNIGSIFLNCAKLSGDIYFEAPDISQATNAFYGCDLTKITIHVPENSTTYDTLIGLYPDANIVTFAEA